MAAALLQCPNCKAPLPKPVGGFAVCPYCNATMSVAEVNVAQLPEPAHRPPERSFKERIETTQKTFQRVIDAKGTLEQAAWYAAHDFAEPSFDPGDVARGTLALARDFDPQGATGLLRDASAIVRLMEAYVKVSIELRKVERSEVNLPFLATNNGSPVHYQRELTARSLATLVASYPWR